MIEADWFGGAVMRNLLFFVLSAATVFAQDGAAIYKARCAGCHDTPSGRIPPFSALRTMAPAKILESLENGPMKTQAAGLSSGERYALVTFLASPGAKLAQLHRFPQRSAMLNRSPYRMLSKVHIGAYGARILQTRAFKTRRKQD